MQAMLFEQTDTRATILEGSLVLNTRLCVPTPRSLLKTNLAVNVSFLHYNLPVFRNAMTLQTHAEQETGSHSCGDLHFELLELLHLSIRNSGAKGGPMGDTGFPGLRQPQGLQP